MRRGRLLEKQTAAVILTCRKHTLATELFTLLLFCCFETGVRIIKVLLVETAA